MKIIPNLERERQGFQFCLPMYWLGSVSQEACDPSGKKSKEAQEDKMLKKLLPVAMSTLVTG